MFFLQISEASKDHGISSGKNKDIKRQSENHGRNRSYPAYVWQMTYKWHISGWPWLEVMFVVALVLENVLRIRLLGSLVESSCDQGDWFQWWFFFYLLWGGWFNHSCARKMLGGNHQDVKLYSCLFLVFFYQGRTLLSHICREVCGSSFVAMTASSTGHLDDSENPGRSQFLLRMQLATSDFYTFWSPGWLYESQVVQDFFNQL